MPKMISGTIMGRVDRYSMGALSRHFTRVMPKAPRVPIIPAQRQLDRPRIRVFPRASSMARSRNSWVYHLREKPLHTEEILLSLKE